jgi:hypothetical protein
VDAVGVALVTVLVGLVVAWILALVDAVRRPEWQWHTARRSKPGWVLGVTLVGWVAGVVYLVSVRPQLARAGRAARTAPSPAQAKVPRRKKDWGDPWKDE